MKGKVMTALRFLGYSLLVASLAVALPIIIMISVDARGISSEYSETLNWLQSLLPW